MASFLKGAMRALAQHPKTAKFFDTRDYADLPRGWSDDPEIEQLARAAYSQAGIESPFFKAYFGDSRLVDADGVPIVMYHGSKLPGLKSISPSASKYGIAFASEHPGTALSYLVHPGARLRASDPVYGDFYDAAEKVLLSGKSLMLPDGDEIFLPGGKRFGWSAIYGDNTDLLAEKMSELTGRLNHMDFLENMDRLRESQILAGPGNTIPREDLAMASVYRPYHELFLADNAAALKKAAGHPIEEAFGGQLGTIYPAYVSVRNPLVVTGTGKVSDWTDLAQFAVDPGTMTGAERAAARWNAGDPAPRVGDVYPELHLDTALLPTDKLASYLRSTDHDALVMRGIRDGGSQDVPPTTTVAVQRASQFKSPFNSGMFRPDVDNMFRGVLPYAAAGGALAAAMGAPSSASAAVPAGWVPPSAKAELEGMEPPVWLDPVELISSFASAGGSTAFRTGQTALDAAQGWLADKIPAVPDIPEEYREAAQ